jgi:hypothetical protein
MTTHGITATEPTGLVTVSCLPFSLGAGMAIQSGTARSAIPVQKPSQSLKTMLTAIELDQRRADFMDMIYERAGRNDQLYTGLWDEFSREVASNLRDLDYNVFRSDLIRAAGGADSELANRYADVAITLLTTYLVPPKP